ncbi:MAG: ThiF family adenylyltransferase [Eubacteriales bacterium]|nr:ThiF family adenylyltransferase [Eubacteriales bacterium]
MLDAFSRMEMLLGAKEADQLARARIAVFGLGGVGSYIVETLARCGVGCLTLVDGDSIDITDINRQLFAFRSTVGRSKVEVAKEYIRDIDDRILVNTYGTYYRQETADMIDFHMFDYVVDATNSRKDKMLIAGKAAEHKIPVITCINVENRMDPSKFELLDLSKVQLGVMNPMLRKIKSEFRQVPTGKIKLLFSREKGEESRGSIAFVPGMAGLVVAREIVKDILSAYNAEHSGEQGSNQKTNQKLKKK